MTHYALWFRWKQRGGAATNICLGSSAALQLAAQLRDKQRAFSLFCDFLRSVGLWQRLGLVSTGIPTYILTWRCAFTICSWFLRGKFLLDIKVTNVMILCYV